MPDQIDAKRLLLDSLNRQKKSLAAAKRLLNHAPTVEAVNAVAVVADDADLYVGTCGSAVNVSVTMRGLAGFRDPRLMLALEQLLDAGFVFDRTKDYPLMMNRDYFAKCGAVSLSLYAYAGASETCQRRVVSKKTVEVEEYEIVCE